VPWEEADLFCQMMVLAAGNRRLVLILAVWKFVRDRVWPKDGRSRCTERDAAQALGVSLRTVKTYFKMAQDAHLIRQDGWTVTKRGRVGLWVAIPASFLELALGDAALHLNGVQALNSTPSTTGASSELNGCTPANASTYTPSEHPDVQSGIDVPVREGEVSEGVDGNESTDTPLDSREKSGTSGSTLQDEMQGDDESHQAPLGEEFQYRKPEVTVDPEPEPLRPLAEVYQDWLAERVNTPSLFGHPDWKALPLEERQRRTTGQEHRIAVDFGWKPKEAPPRTEAASRANGSHLTVHRELETPFADIDADEYARELQTA